MSLDRQQAQEELHRRLVQLHEQAGRPRFRELAERTGRPAVEFAAMIVRPEQVPTWDQVGAFLAATGQTDASLRGDLHRLWQDAVDREQAADDGHPGPHGRALRCAAHAVSRPQFATALGLLKQESRRSYREISQATQNRLPPATAHWMAQPRNFPARREQVEQFVTGCGVRDDDVRLWLGNWERIRLAAGPPGRAASTPPGADALPPEPLAKQISARLGALSVLLTSVDEQYERTKRLMTDKPHLSVGVMDPLRRAVNALAAAQDAVASTAAALTEAEAAARGKPALGPAAD